MGKLQPTRLKESDVQVACRNALHPLLLSLTSHSAACSSRLARSAQALLYKAGGLYASMLRSLLQALLDFVSHGTWGSLCTVAFLWMCCLYVAACCYSLSRQTADKIETVVRLCGAAGEERRVFHHAQLEGLPEPVQRYFKYALQDGQQYIKFCTIKQKGQFRIRVGPGLTVKEGWKKVRASQYFTTAQPAYVWAAWIWLAPLVWVRGWDSYVPEKEGLQGPGEMFWRLFSAITLLEKRGPEVDQANLSRYLAEACYIPTALLPGQHVSWRAIDSDRAEATLWHAGSKAVAEFHFNEKGQITKMTATDRARRLGDGEFNPGDLWMGRYSDYIEHGGVRIPQRMECIWVLHNGATPCPYADLSITDYRCFTRIGRTSMAGRT
eukprot:jgi/Astpho2/4025/Aster-01183